MTNVIDRQTVVFSINLATLLPSMAQIPMNLRFAADELVLKSLAYSEIAVTPDTDDDGLLTAFPIILDSCNNSITISQSTIHFKQVILRFNFNRLRTEHHFIITHKLQLLQQVLATQMVYFLLH